MQRCLTCCLLAMLLGLTALPALARAPQISAQLTSRQAYVGVPVVLLVSLENVADEAQPELPPIDGLRIQAQGARSVSSQTIIINNQVTQRKSVTFAYAITPLREGSFTIPGFNLRVSGHTLETQPLTFTAHASETGDLMRVQVVTQGPTGYVGQAVQVLLQIDLKPFHDEQFDITLNETYMWHTLSLGQSEWSIFRDALQDLLRQGRRPPGVQVELPDDQGQLATYYRYTIAARIWPRRPGRLDVGEVLIVANYPTGLARARGFGNLVLSGQRPISAAPQIEPVQIRAIPQIDRPDDFTGSVGVYRMRADAQPRQVHVGDPIRLALLVQGDGDLSFLHAPPLAHYRPLVRDFHVPDEPLPGIVQGNQKIFSVSIRPRRDDVTEVPALPLTYFNPSTEQFETTWTEPIPITVRPMDRMDLDQIVSAHGAGPAPPESDQAPRGPRVPGDPYRMNAYGGANLLATASRPSGRILTLVAVLPPLLVLAAVGVAQTRRRLRTSATLRRRRLLHQARAGVDHASDPGQIMQALVRLVSAAGGRHTNGLTAQEACVLLERGGLSAQIIEAWRTCLAACEEQRYLQDGQYDLPPLKTQAHACLAQMQPLLSMLEAQRRDT